MEKINFSFVKGDTFNKGIKIENWVLPIDEIYFTVKEKSSDKNYVLQKKINKGIEIDLEIPDRYILNIDADDTNDLKTNYDYVFDVEIVSDYVKRTIIGGILRLEDWDITSKRNEV